MQYWETWMNVIELPNMPGVSSNYDICKSKRPLGYCVKMPIPSEELKPVECTKCLCCKVD